MLIDRNLACPLKQGDCNTRRWRTCVLQPSSANQLVDSLHHAWFLQGHMFNRVKLPPGQKPVWKHDLFKNGACKELLVIAMMDAESFRLSLENDHAIFQGVWVKMFIARSQHHACGCLRLFQLVSSELPHLFLRDACSTDELRC